MEFPISKTSPPMNSATIPRAIMWMGLLTPLACDAQSQGGETMPEYRDAATHEDLEKTLRHAEATNPLANFKVDDGPDPSMENRPIDIIEDSDIISFNGLTTLVPKRAILAIPASVQNRVGRHVPGHRVVAWKEFLFANRGWVSTVEVSRSQAEGRQDLAEAVIERISRSTNLMVATYQGGPISVLPPMPAESCDEAVPPAAESSRQPTLRRP